MQPNPLHVAEDLWVFAYGSLMWRPDFPFVERVEARLVGAHRALCVYSFVHRGTPERPGLVLGLDQGGTCRGVAYRVSAADRASTIAYLRAREQVTSVYRECIRPIWLKREPEQRVSALCYMVDRGHPQYAGRLMNRSWPRRPDGETTTRGRVKVMRRVKRLSYDCGYARACPR